jgi:hypothetical protein
MTQLTPACLRVSHGFHWVPIETILAIVAVAPRRVVAAFDTHAATAPARQQIKLLVESAALSV